MKVWVTGASGFLGKKIVNTLSHLGYEVIPVYHKTGSKFTCDLADFKSIDSLLKTINPDWVIHTAAITDLDQVEENPILAKLVNADATVHLGRWCKDNSKRLIYVSTDYVFDGESSPYNENATPCPIQLYGYTKLLGENVLNISSDFVMVRPGILHGFNDLKDKLTVTLDIVRKLKTGIPFELDDFRIKYPTLIDDVVYGILEIIELRKSGVFHVCGPDGLTRYGWGQKIAEHFGVSKDLIIPNPELDKNTKPLRPRNVKLVNTRLKYRAKNIDESLEIIKKQIKGQI